MKAKEFITKTNLLPVRKVIGIYMIYCIGNDKIYIGQSKNIYHRIYQHKLNLKNKTHANPLLQSIWNKYKEDKFLFKVIQEFDKTKTKEELEKIESDYLINIDKEDLINLQGVKMFKTNFEIRKKQSEAHKGKKHTEEQKKKISENNKGKNLGRKHTKEELEKMSLAKKGKPRLNTKRKLSAEIINNIRTDFLNGIFQCDLSRKYKLRPQLIMKICKTQQYYIGEGIDKKLIEQIKEKYKDSHP